MDEHDAGRNDHKPDNQGHELVPPLKSLLRRHLLYRPGHVLDAKEGEHDAPDQDPDTDEEVLDVVQSRVEVARRVPVAVRGSGDSPGLGGFCESAPRKRDSQDKERDQRNRHAPAASCGGSFGLSRFSLGEGLCGHRAVPKAERYLSVIDIYVPG